MDMFSKYDFLSLSSLNSGQKDGRRERERGMEKRERRERRERRDKQIEDGEIYTQGCRGTRIQDHSVRGIKGSRGLNT